MSPQEIDALRKEVKKIMIDLDLDNRKAGVQTHLAADLSARTGKTISLQTLCMALTGFRSTAAYQTLLKELHAMLAERIRNHFISPQEIDALRKEVKKIMIDLDLDNRKAGIRTHLAVDLSARTGKTICRQTLNMALTGFRSTASYQTILQELHAMLAERVNLPA